MHNFNEPACESWCLLKWPYFANCIVQPGWEHSYFVGPSRWTAMRWQFSSLSDRNVTPLQPSMSQQNGVSAPACDKAWFDSVHFVLNSFPHSEHWNCLSSLPITVSACVGYIDMDGVPLETLHGLELAVSDVVSTGFDETPSSTGGCHLFACAFMTLRNLNSFPQVWHAHFCFSPLHWRSCASSSLLWNRTCLLYTSDAADE